MTTAVTRTRTIVDLLCDAARDHTESGLRYPRGADDQDAPLQSYSGLLDEARSVLTGLRERGLAPGDKVVLLLEKPREFLAAFWACQLGGFVPCPMAALGGDPERWAAQLTHVDTLLGQPLIVTSATLAAELPRVEGLSVVPLEDLRAEHLADSFHEADPKDDAVLVLTSGSTGNSKAVMLSHANLLASMAAKNGYHGLTAQDISLNWVSFDHVAALLECHLLPLYAGSTQLHVEAPVVLQEPLNFLRIISGFGVTMTFTPNFLLGLINPQADRLDEENGDEIDLSRLRHVISGGEAVVRTTGETFLSRFAPYGLRADALWPAFGMSETCAGSIYSVDFPAADQGQEFANLGQPVEGLRIRVADEAHRELPAGAVGELQLNGPMITAGYYNNEQATQDAFTPDGWFRSGDLGRIDDGRLTLVGRTKDSVIVNGVNYFSHDIETLLEGLDDVAPSLSPPSPPAPPAATPSNSWSPSIRSAPTATSSPCTGC